MIAHTEEATGVEIPHKILPRRAGDLANVYADASKAKAELGREAKTDAKTSIANSRKFVQQSSKKVAE